MKGEMSYKKMIFYLKHHCQLPPTPEKRYKLVKKVSVFCLKYLRSNRGRLSYFVEKLCGRVTSFITGIFRNTKKQSSPTFHSQTFSLPSGALKFMFTAERSHFNRSSHRILRTNLVPCFEESSA